MSNLGGNSAFGGPKRRTGRLDKENIRDVPQTGPDIGANRDRRWLIAVAVVCLLLAAVPVKLYLDIRARANLHQQQIQTFSSATKKWYELTRTGDTSADVPIGEKVAILDCNTQQISALNMDLVSARAASNPAEVKTVICVETTALEGLAQPKTADGIVGRTTAYLTRLQFLNLETDELSDPIIFTTRTGNPEIVQEEKETIVRNSKNTFKRMRKYLTDKGILARQ